MRRRFGRGRMNRGQGEARGARSTLRAGSRASSRQGALPVTALERGGGGRGAATASPCSRPAPREGATLLVGFSPQDGGRRRARDARPAERAARRAGLRGRIGFALAPDLVDSRRAGGSSCCARPALRFRAHGGLGDSRTTRGRSRRASRASPAVVVTPRQLAAQLDARRGPRDLRCALVEASAGTRREARRRRARRRPRRASWCCSPAASRSCTRRRGRGAARDGRARARRARRSSSESIADCARSARGLAAQAPERSARPRGRRGHARAGCAALLGERRASAAACCSGRSRERTARCSISPRVAEDGRCGRGGRARAHDASRARRDPRRHAGAAPALPALLRRGARAAARGHAAARCSPRASTTRSCCGRSQLLGLETSAYDVRARPQRRVRAFPRDLLPADAAAVRRASAARRRRSSGARREPFAERPAREPLPEREARRAPARRAPARAQRLRASDRAPESASLQDARRGAPSPPRRARERREAARSADAAARGGDRASRRSRSSIWRTSRPRARGRRRRSTPARGVRGRGRGRARRAEARGGDLTPGEEASGARAASAARPRRAPRAPRRESRSEAVPSAELDAEAGAEPTRAARRDCAGDADEIDDEAGLDARRGCRSSRRAGPELRRRGGAGEERVTRSASGASASCAAARASRSGEPEAAPAPAPQLPRRRAAFLAHADRDSVAAAVLLARDLRMVEGIWVYPQADLMTFFRSVATDLREETPIYRGRLRRVAARATRSRRRRSTAAAWPGSTTTSGRPRTSSALREAIGADVVHVSRRRAARCRSCSSRAHAAQPLLRQARRPDHGPLLAARLRALGPALVAPPRRARGEAAASAARGARALLVGRPSRARARGGARAARRRCPQEVEYVAARDFRLVHFGGYALVVVPVPPELDLHLSARIARERYRRAALAGVDRDGRRALSCWRATRARAPRARPRVDGRAPRREARVGRARCPTPTTSRASACATWRATRSASTRWSPRSRWVARSSRGSGATVDRRTSSRSSRRSRAKGRTSARRRCSCASASATCAVAGATRRTPGARGAAVASSCARQRASSASCRTRSRSRRCVAAARRARARAPPFVSLTGGEPLLQPEAVGALAARAARPRAAHPPRDARPRDRRARRSVVDTSTSSRWTGSSRATCAARADPHARRGRAVPRRARAPSCASRGARREVFVKIVVTPASERRRDRSRWPRASRAIDAARLTLVLQPVTPRGAVRERPSAAAHARARRRAPSARLADVRVIPQTHPIYGRSVAPASRRRGRRRRGVASRLSTRASPAETVQAQSPAATWTATRAPTTTRIARALDQGRAPAGIVLRRLVAAARRADQREAEARRRGAHRATLPGQSKPTPLHATVARGRMVAARAAGRGAGRYRRSRILQSRPRSYSRRS